MLAANMQSLNQVKKQLWGAWMFVIAKGQPAGFHKEKVMLVSKLCFPQKLRRSESYLSATYLFSLLSKAVSSEFVNSFCLFKKLS